MVGAMNTNAHPFRSPWQPPAAPNTKFFQQPKFWHQLSKVFWVSFLFFSAFLLTVISFFIFGWFEEQYEMLHLLTRISHLFGHLGSAVLIAFCAMNEEKCDARIYKERELGI